MILTADYHTHTVFSHGKGQVIDNALAAKQKGLLEVGISDHGFAHPAFGLRKRKVPKLKEECRLATVNTGVKTLVGIESNIISVDGKCDLKEKYFDDFDIFLAGFHKFVMFSFPTWFKLFFPNMFTAWIKKGNAPARLVKENTLTFVNVIKKNPVDVITHLNFFCFSDPVEVAKAAADYGTYIELNAKKIHLKKEEIAEIVAKTQARFIISSDAHTSGRVGEISLVQKELADMDFPLDRIDNIDGRLPQFRFKREKERR